MPSEQRDPNEPRYLIIGKLKKEKFYLAVFTLRERKIRIISARAASKDERGTYYERKSKDS